MLLAGAAAIVDGSLRVKRGHKRWAAIAEICAGALVVVALFVITNIPSPLGIIFVIAGLAGTAILAIVALIIDRPQSTPNLILSIVALIFAVISLAFVVPVVMLAFTGMGP